jgi:tetratricopeptide (TPR) repeat protein
MLLIASVEAVAQPAAEIVNLEGKGEMREAQQANWRAAAPKQPLFATNFVRTLDMSRMAILFTDRTQVRLSANSTLQIKEAAGADAKTIINLNAGRSWVTSKAPPKGLTMETPSAVAAIRGTEWEMAVDDEGRATLTVFSGEVEFFNDRGAVLVGAYEQARAERGKAPVKLQLRVSRERVQWVSAFAVDARRYGAGAAPDIERLVAEQRLAEAYQLLRQRSASSDAGAVTYLLLADFEVYRGDLEAADRILQAGAARFPGDERFDVALARSAFFADRADEARKRAEAALAKRPDSVEALLVLGDIERNQGRGREATAAYSRAAALAATDARPWHGLGIVESERENVRPARSHLQKAIALDPTESRHFGELGTLEAFAGNLPRARAALLKAIAANPNDYVALTGLGVVELKFGRPEAALDALTRATLVEPRYARAYLYTAAAYYDLGRETAALESLARAAELDPNDPLPHTLTSIVYLDRIEPLRAAEAAQRALDRMPYLKSLNQVANNQKGIANAGYPLAFMGLEAWARNAAQESYLPSWAGSHLFLADRYPGDFSKRSELMQGYITDPLVFGASNRMQDLVLAPGNYGTVTLRGLTSANERLLEPVLTVNGYSAAATPFAYFGEVAYSDVDPRNLAFKAHQPSVTAALGVKPTYELGLFAFFNHLDSTSETGQRGVTGQFSDISGKADRIDTGLRYAPDSRTNLWIKAGAGREDSTSNSALSFLEPGVSLTQGLTFNQKPERSDAGARFTRRIREDVEVTLGAEAGRADNTVAVRQDSVFHAPGASVNQNRSNQTERDRSHAVHASVRATLGGVLFEAGVVARDYRKDFDAFVIRNGAAGELHEDYRRKGVDPLIGLAWRPSANAVVRGACRRWVRPAALDSILPVAIAGVPLDDQLVLPGGKLEQCRGQGDWTFARHTFASISAERIETSNLVSDIAGVLNVPVELTDIERLRNRLLTPIPLPDQLEGVPVYAGAVIRRGSVWLEHVVGRGLAVHGHYVYTDSGNTDLPPFGGKRVPYLARHQADLGLAWTPGRRVRFAFSAIHRTQRFTDELNRDPIRAGWDGYVSAFIETPDKRWTLELQALNLWKRDTVERYGMILGYRF